MKQNKLILTFILLFSYSISSSIFASSNQLKNSDRGSKIGFLEGSLSNAICDQTKEFKKTSRFQEALDDPSKFPQYADSKACNKFLWRDCSKSAIYLNAKTCEGEDSKNGEKCEKFTKRSCTKMQTRKASSNHKPECVSDKPSDEEMIPNENYFWLYEEKTRCYYNISLTPELQPRFLFKKSKEVKFILFTSKNPKGTGEELKANDKEALQKSGYVSNAPLKIICHGFRGSSKEDPGPMLRDAYFARENNYNVVLVDWTSMAQTLNYFRAAADTKQVGIATSVFVAALVEHNLVSLEQIHFIGHSLGAHVGGHFGRSMMSINKPVGRITGLDPAGPLFTNKPNSDRLDLSDAQFVDIIHTNTKFKGISATLGHVDFYVNSGRSQPQCGFDILGTCSHAAVYKYFAESIESNTKFKSCKCPTWEAFLKGACEAINHMGEYANKSVPGIFFLATNTNGMYSKT